MGSEKLKVVTGRIGVDPHDLGVRLVTRGLREAGMEVVYLGGHLSPEMIVNSAIQEGADVIGISTYMPSGVLFLKRLMKLMKEKNIQDIMVFVGGAVNDDDARDLKAAGVAATFPQGTQLEDVVKTVASLSRGKKAKVKKAK